MTGDTPSQLKPADPGAIDDWPQLVLDQLRDSSHRHGYTKLCPLCGGHGGWNLQLNAHPLPPSCGDTLHNRHLFVHSRAQCSHCAGWGWVHPNDNCPAHDFVKIRSKARCLHIYRCNRCGTERVVDSSD